MHPVSQSVSQPVLTDLRPGPQLPAVFLVNTSKPAFCFEGISAKREPLALSTTLSFTLVVQHCTRSLPTTPHPPSLLHLPPAPLNKSVSLSQIVINKAKKSSSKANNPRRGLQAVLCAAIEQCQMVIPLDRVVCCCRVAGRPAGLPRLSSDGPAALQRGLPGGNGYRLCPVSTSEN